jgi:hypothetical protein
MPQKLILEKDTGRMNLAVDGVDDEDISKAQFDEILLHFEFRLRSATLEVTGIVTRHIAPWTHSHPASPLTGAMFQVTRSSNTTRSKRRYITLAPWSYLDEEDIMAPHNLAAQSLQ